MNDRGESPEERKRRLARQRKQKQREREKAHLQSVGAKKFEIIMYSGTREALSDLMTFNGSEEWQEVVTLLIHNAAELINSDKSLLAELLNSGTSRTSR